MELKDRLAAVYAKASQGKWAARDGRIYSLDPAGRRWYAVCNFGGLPDYVLAEQDKANIELVETMHECLPIVLEAFEALEAARWALWSLSNQAADHAEVCPELSEPWNQGGEAYEAAHKVRAVLDKLHALSSEDS